MEKRQIPVVLHVHDSTAAIVPEDRAAIARAIGERVRELGWRQRALVQRSRVCPANLKAGLGTVIERARHER